MHPFVKCFSRSPSLEQLRYGSGELFDFAAVHRFHHRVSIREVPIQGADADGRTARDFLQAHVRADLGECGFGGIDQQLPVAGAVGARFARCGYRLTFRVDRPAP
jgi:hypothetical protein